LIKLGLSLLAILCIQKKEELQMETTKTKPTIVCHAMAHVTFNIVTYEIL